MSTALAPGHRSALLEVFTSARRAATAYARPDLVRRVDAVASRLDDRAVVVAVTGDFGSGKSSLVNALVQMSVCPASPERCTTVPTAVRYAPRTTVTAVRSVDGEEPARGEIAFADLAPLVSGEPAGLAAPGDSALAGVEVCVPAPLLAGGLVLVDCPAEGGLASMGRMASLAHVAGAAALIFVTDASGELSAPELAFLAVAATLCPEAVVALTKIDLVPAWRDVFERNAARLCDAGLGHVEQLPVSADLRALAAAAGDPALEAVAGFAALEAWLTERVIGNAERLTLRAALVELAAVTDQLDQQFEAERLALVDPAAATELAVELEAAAGGLHRLRERAARWQHVLSDGAADLTADVDHDLRDRLRRVGREADDTIDAEDPADIWPTFEPWLYGRVADEVTANFVLLQSRAADLAASVARLFDAEADAALRRQLSADAGAAMDDVALDASVELTRMSAAQRAFAALRGSYGGVLMATLAARSHLPFAPTAALMGVLLGNKAVKDESERQLTQRRAAAKAAQRRYCDEVAFVAGKHSRDHLRRIQRTLRDHFLQRADELEASGRAALEAVKEATTERTEERRKRLADVEEELRRIRGLGERIAGAARQLAEEER